MNEKNIRQAYELAVERYAAIGIDVEKVMGQFRRYSCPCIVGKPMM